MIDRNEGKAAGSWPNAPYALQTFKIWNNYYMKLMINYPLRPSGKYYWIDQDATKPIKAKYFDGNKMLEMTWNDLQQTYWTAQI